MSFRFALLRHEMPADASRPSHWDLLLEREQACWTCAIEVLPAGLANSGPGEVEATRLPDHRKHYLSYQGPLTKQRGDVTQVLAGDCVWLEDTSQRIAARLRFDNRENCNACLLTAKRNQGDIWLVSLTTKNEQPQAEAAG